MRTPIPYIAEYFNQPVNLADVPYFTLGASPTSAGVAGLDSSDQDVFTFEQFAGITAYRSGLVYTDADNLVTHLAIDDIQPVVALPGLHTAAGLRLKLALEHRRRLRSGYRLHFSSLQKVTSFIHPRLVAATEREITDYQFSLGCLNSLYHRPGLLFLRDGRLNAHKFPGPPAYDRLYRLMTARGVRAIGLAKTAQILEVVRPLAQAIRRQVGDRPFALPILRSHLTQAHPGDNSAFLKTLRHGSSNQAYGGSGAVRFALSLSGEELHLVEFNLYDLARFQPLVYSGQTLEDWAEQTLGKRTIFSWNILPLVTDQDWLDLFLPTLEQLVYSAYAGGEIGLYPRALAEVHNRVKLRWAEVEELRREIATQLGWHDIPPERVPEYREDPHKFDPEVVNHPGYVTVYQSE